MTETRQRVGMGFDVHPFAAERALVLGGVRIREHDGLLGHSDADALIHALCDALLGAAGLDDIGHQFPDSDPAYASIDSRILLRRVIELLRKAAYVPVNVDLTVIAQAPKLAPHFPAMKAALAPILGLPTERIGLKATTNEGLQSWGYGEGIACMAICLIETAGQYLDR